MPFGLLVAYAEQVDRLRAEEALGAYEVAVAAGGNLEPRSAREVVHGWSRRASGDAEGPRRMSTPVVLSQLVAMGFEVVPAGGAA